MPAASVQDFFLLPAARRLQTSSNRERESVSTGAADHVRARLHPAPLVTHTVPAIPSQHLLLALHPKDAATDAIVAAAVVNRLNSLADVPLLEPP